MLCTAIMTEGRMNKVDQVVVNRAMASNNPKYLIGMKLADNNTKRPRMMELLVNKMGLPVSSKVWAIETR